MSDVIKVQEYKDEMMKHAEELVIKGFPETIVKLNAILETTQFKNRPLYEVQQDLNIPIPEPIMINSLSNMQPTKKAKLDNSTSSSFSSPEGSRVMYFPTGSVPSNKNLVDLIEFVKPHIRKLVEDLNLIKMWISLMIPKIEDGNNFGVSVQEDILLEVQLVESTAAAFFDQLSIYFISRGKLISRVAKYPYIDDYRQAVQKLDEKEYLSLWLVMSEIRNRYCAIHDLVVKNLDKLKKPRTTVATESMY